MTRPAPWLVPAFLVATATACQATLVPPLRTGISTIPEPAGTHAGAVQVGGGFTGFFGHVEPRLILGVGPRLDLDLDLMAWPPYQVVMGSVGLRWYPVIHRYWRLGLTAGAGVGTGGWFSYPDASEDNGVKTEFDHSLNGGAYVGLDLGIRLHRVIGLYLGQRFHLTRSGNIPVTGWGGHIFGIHLDLLPRWYVTVETGIYWYATPSSGRILPDSSWGFTMIHATTGVRFGKVPPQVSPFARRARPEPDPPPLPVLRPVPLPVRVPPEPPPRVTPPPKKRSVPAERERQAPGPQ